MRYSNIITYLANSTNTPGFLAKINLWPLVNIKFFMYKSTSVIFFFLSNLSNFKIKFVKIHNYLLFLVYTIVVSLIVAILVLLCL
jgi:hypothetical protein